MEMQAMLANVTWHSLVGPHARFAWGEGGARRYEPGFSPIAAFAHPVAPDLPALAAVARPQEQLYVAGWSGPVPAGWRLDAQESLLRMVWEGGREVADEATDAVLLDARHAQQALALVEVTRPGPFGPRTLELGEYFGYFAGDRLLAMAGERMCAPPLREISGVCTHPQAQGRGLARRLMTKLMHRQIARGEQPFLHVMADNTRARDLYLRMGFQVHAEVPMRVISRC